MIISTLAWVTVKPYLQINKQIKIILGRKRLNLTLIDNVMQTIVCLENPKEQIKNLLELISSLRSPETRLKYKNLWHSDIPAKNQIPANWKME